MVIPALNEERNIAPVLESLPADVFEVVLVDGESVDRTTAVARAARPDIRIVSQNRRGKGNALACGFESCTGDLVVALDADGSTDPQEIPRFVAALVDGAEFVKGSRFLDGGGSADITPVRRLGNAALCRFANRSFGTAYTDLCYGYNAFWRRCLPMLGLTSRPVQPGAEQQWGDGFEIETLMNVRAAATGLRVAEVPSFERERISGASRLHPVRDGVRVVKTIRRERRQRQGALCPKGVSPAARPERKAFELPEVSDLAESGALSERS